MPSKLASVVAAVAAALLVGACDSGPTHPDSSTTSSSPGLSASITTTSPTPTLDCARSTVKAQQLVCSDPELTVLDRRTQTAYQQAQARPGADKATLATAQSAFMTIRDGCSDFVDTRTCLVEAYQTRLVELAIADSVSPAARCSRFSRIATSAITSAMNAATAMCASGRPIAALSTSSDTPSAIPSIQMTIDIMSQLPLAHGPVAVRDAR